MDDRRFDELTRTLATSRRGALKTLAGVAAGGLLALLDPITGDAQRRPRRPRPPRPPRRNRNRPGICAGRRDFARCGGECGRCLSGQCVPDHASCFECDFCDFDSLMCLPIAEGQTCGNQGCMTCQGGACVPAREGEECGDCGTCRGGACVGEGEGACGECGACEGGLCVPKEERCDPDCEICDGDALTCVSMPFEGLLCGIDCGVCRDGACVADASLCPEPGCQTCNAQTKRCDSLPDDFVCAGECGVCRGGACVVGGCQEPECSACNPDSAMCEPVNEGGACGNCGECQGGQCANQDACGACGVCADGQCMPDNARCAGDCELCVQTGRNSTCIQAEDLSDCGNCGVCVNGVCINEGLCGECGACLDGECVPDDTRCEECQVCNGLFACDPAPTGTPCSVGTCRFGLCCPPGTGQCGTTCCDPNPPACEFCQLIEDPSAPNGLRGQCGSGVAAITEICANNDVGVFFPPDAPCGACCAQSGTPCQRGANARYRCCSGGTCDVTTDFICP